MKLTQGEVKKKGFTIDTSCYPNIAYKGLRFAPDESVYVYTKLETELLEALKPFSNSVLPTIDDNRHNEEMVRCGFKIGDLKRAKQIIEKIEREYNEKRR